MRAIVVTRSLDLAAPPERVWPFLADTDRFNRLIGMHEVSYRPVEAQGRASGARFVVETRAAGLNLVYEEFPFEWTHQRTFGVHRRMRGGPIESYTWRITLDESRVAANGGGTPRGGLEGGTRVGLRFEIVPRIWAFAPIAWVNARLFAAKVAELGAMVDAHVLEGAPSPYVKPVSPSDAGLVEAALQRLRKDVKAELAARLGALVRDGPDAEVVRIRPFALADTWKEDRREVLRAMLHAVPAGLVELRWGVICPSCLTASQQLRGLEEITAEGHCQLCDITFGLDLDRAVEATFLPHPSVRRVPEGMFCIGGPARTPHVLVQAVVEAKKERTLMAPRESGRYRLFARGGAVATVDVDDAGAPTALACLEEDGRIDPARIHVAPGGGVRVSNHLADVRHVKIERLDFASTAATAHVVSTLPEFRTIFSSDLLKRGTPLKVARAAVLFSDLTGSTALYTRVGDAAAFRLVDDHFDVIRGVVAAHEGVLVKTMGDAVMAAFVDVNHCARAAVDALARFEKFRASEKHGVLVGLKLGLYAGACYVVTANGALDYFGQTVNVASRVQHLAESGQIVMPCDVLESLAARERDSVKILERFQARVKGVEQPLDLVRAALSSS